MDAREMLLADALDTAIEAEKHNRKLKIDLAISIVINIAFIVLLLGGFYG